MRGSLAAGRVEDNVVRAANKSGERTRPRVLAMAPRHREFFFPPATIVSARAPKPARDGACAPQTVAETNFGDASGVALTDVTLVIVTVLTSFSPL